MIFVLKKIDDRDAKHSKERNKAGKCEDKRTILI